MFNKIIPFYKYQGTGNDFVMIDGRYRTFFDLGDGNSVPIETEKLVAKLCDRRFGIGGDGLIVLRNKTGYDFEMIYFNSDGRLSSMCGNGGRCIVAFANQLGINRKNYHFLAVDGPHDAIIPSKDYIHLKMQDVTTWKMEGDTSVMNTGSPHFIQFMENVQEAEMVSIGKKIRYNEFYRKDGINVNIVELQEHGLFMRTYERGVEDETLSCGTGVTAAALSSNLKDSTKYPSPIKVKTLGGDLSVSFQQEKNMFKNIWLCGPAKCAFQGNWSIE
jgi:diaminopimelate epimerase